MPGEYPPEDYLERDEDGLIINDPQTYQELSNLLWMDKQVWFPWSDQHGTRLDIYMAFGGVQLGELQDGLSTDADLIVGIPHYGFWGFELNGNLKHPTYVAEKLGMEAQSVITKQLAQLINGVSEELLK